MSQKAALPQLPAATLELVSVRRVASSLTLGPHQHSKAAGGEVRVTLEATFQDQDGHQQLGIAAPLSGYSPDALEEAEASLMQLCGSELSLPVGTLLERLAAVEPRLGALSPSARFAVEMAIVRFAVEAVDTALAYLLEPSALSTTATAWVLEPSDDLERLEKTPVAAFKLKLGRRPIEEELGFLARVRERFPHTPIRLDANGRFARSWQGLLAQLGAYSPAWVEELVSAEELWAPGDGADFQPSPSVRDVNLAVDESLFRRVPALLPNGSFFPAGVTVAVLKPTCLGGILATARWVEAARASQVEPVLSHTLEPAPVRALLGELARAWMSGSVASGLGPYPGESCSGEQHDLAATISPRLPELSVRAAAKARSQGAAWLSGDQQVSFRELARQVELCVGRLHTEGLRVPARPLETSSLGDEGFSAEGEIKVAFVAKRGLGSFVLLHAMMEAGLCAVPIHPRWTMAERKRARQHVSPNLFIEDPDAFLAQALNESPQRISQLPARPPSHHGDRPFAVVFSSGTSGAPKAVVISRRAVHAAAQASFRNLPQSAGDRWLLAMPLAHVGALSVVTRALLSRAAVVALPEGRFEPEQVWSWVNAHRVTHASLVPTMLHRMLDAGVPDETTLRTVLLGGAAASSALLAKAQGVGLQVLTTYGMSETFGQVITQAPGMRRVRGTDEAVDLVPVGRPLPGVQVRIQGTGDVGELEVKSPSLMDGYLEEDGAVTTPLRDGWFATGDLAAIQHGELCIHGRLGDRIVTGGENVDPVEVEARLAEAKGVENVCVVALPDEEHGEIVVAAFQGSASPADMRAAAETLAPFKRPRRYYRLPLIPTGLTGKIDRRATRFQLEVVAPKEAGPGPGPAS